MKGFALSRKRFEKDEKWPMIPLYSARGIWAGGRDVRNHAPAERNALPFFPEVRDDNIQC